MKKSFAIIAVLLIAGMIFGSVSAQGSNARPLDQPMMKKTPPPNNPGMEKKATMQADKDLRQAEQQLQQAEKKPGKKVMFRGTVEVVGDASFNLNVGGEVVTFAVDDKTQFKIPTLGKTADLKALNVGVKASVQAVEMTAPVGGEPQEVAPAVEQPVAPASFLALKVNVIPGKPVRIHRVGVVTNYQPGVSITIQAKDMQLYTFLIAPDAKILPAERADQLAVGVFVTIISRRDPTGGPLTAQGIVVHPKTEENVTEPTDITLSASSVAENAPVGTVVGTFTAVDPTPGDTFTFTLVLGTGDTDNAAFTISGANLLTAAVFNFEVKSSYSIRVRVTDQNGSFFEKVFTITVTNVVELPPTDITLTPTSVAENVVVGTVVGAFTTTDPDVGDIFTYTLVAGTGDTNNAFFTITGANLLTNAPIDFETTPTLSIRVKVTDADGLTFEKVFTITVTNVLDPL